MDESNLYALPPSLAALLDAEEWADLAFVPVPVKPRHDGWTRERQRGFIARLALTGNVSVAAKSVGKSRKSAYDLVARPGAESFAASWARAQSWGHERMRDLAIDRALNGEASPVFFRGRRCGERLRYDNGLLLAALKLLGAPPVRSTER